MESLLRQGFSVETLSSSSLELRTSDDLPNWLGRRGIEFEESGVKTSTLDARGLRVEVPTCYKLVHQRVPVTILRSTSESPYGFGEHEREEFLRHYGETLGRFRPDVVVNYGGDSLAHEVRLRAQRHGATVVFPLHNFNYRDASPFETADAVLVPSRFAADHYRRSLGLDCTVLPNLIDHDRIRARNCEPRFLTFINPSYEKGVYAFARIADELGQKRPDIPLLVVEGRGTERTLADCGLDLRVQGNVNLMAHSSDPRRFWAVTKICLLPSLWWENQPLVAVEAMVNGIPVIGSDRGGIPETLGDAGIILPLPDRLTPFTRELPTSEEVAPWVEAIIRLWDDPAYYAEHSRRSLAESRRWDPDVVEPLYARFFSEVRPKPRPAPTAPYSMPSLPPARQTIEDGVNAIRRRWPDLGSDPEDEPIFLLSAGSRSGSTMLQRLVFGPWFVWGEPFGHAGLVESLSESIRCFTDQWPEPHHFYSGEDAEVIGRKFIANLYPPVRDLRDAHRAYFRTLFEEPARRAGALRWGFKEVRLEVDHALYLKWLFPRAKFLFLVRNPYDAWRSFAARAARGWNWYRRWPDEPVTARSFAAHWRRLATSFRDDHDKVGGLVVRFESLARGEYSDIEGYLGSPLSREVGRGNPGDVGPAPLSEIDAADLAILDEELGGLAASLGYRQSPSHDRDAPTPGFSSSSMATARQPNMDPARCAILVPVGSHIEPACDEALRALERRGYAVRRVRGYSAIDQGRNQIATDALRDGFEELFWIDSDVAFEPDAVQRLRSHGLPIACGVYPMKGRPSFACNFPGEVKRVPFGKSGGLIEIPYAGAGFLHTRREVYTVMQERLRLPSCNERFGPSMVPFFHPMIVPDGQGQWYLAEDYAFSHRARSCGFRIMADTSIRLKHIGSYAYSWEDAGGERERYGDYTFHIVD